MVVPQWDVWSGERCMLAPHAIACPLFQTQWLRACILLAEPTHSPKCRETKPLQPLLCLLDKPEEIVPASKPSRTAENVAIESRVATIKQRPTSRCFPAASDVNVSQWDWVGFGLAWLAGSQRAQHTRGRPVQQLTFNISV